jgi:hypothetical protein
LSFDDSARLLWSLTSNGPATAITTSGNSGAYTATPGPGIGRTAVDLRRADDLWLSAYAAGGAGSNLKVQLNFYDDLGNLFQFITGTTPLLGVTVASAPGQGVSFAGRHGGASGAYLVSSEWGQIAWALTGTMTGVEIALYGR